MRILRRLREESGQTMMMVVILTAALAFSGTMLAQAVQTDDTQSGTANTRQLAFSAAEAGLDDYLSKLLDDNQYYLHYVAPGESTRRSTTGVNVTPVSPPSAPTPWPSAYGTSWTYPNGKDNWVDLGNGYSYNVQVTAPRQGANNTNYLDIVASGKQNGQSASYSTERVIEELLSPSSVADFQMLADANISYGSTATTKGKIYAGVDPNNANNKFSVNHDGNAYGNIYAEGSITGAVNMHGALQYSGAAGNIRSVIKQPIAFTNFTGSFTDIKLAAKNANGIYLNTAGKVWWLTFNSAGTVSISSCNAASAVEDVQPTGCVAMSGSPVALPQNGAIYSEQTVVVAGGSSVCGGTDGVTTQITGSCVHGRVTVASAGDIDIGGNIDYVSPGTDSLGLMASQNMFVTQWAPATLNWRAATLAQAGQWESAPNAPNGSHNGIMTFTGSTAALNGGQMSMFDSRVYQYDPTLAYLQPPWFPTLTNNYTVELFRELPAS